MPQPLTKASPDLSELLPGLEVLQGITRGDPGICVAILDGPVDVAHPCLCGAKLSTLPTVAPAVTTTGHASQHGTHVASLIFGQGDPIAGLAPDCAGLLIPIFSDSADGSIRSCSQLDLARAIDQAVVAGADIISISAGQLANSVEAEDYLAKAVRNCEQKNVLIVAAAGNDGCDCLHVPAAVPSVLAVGAMDRQGAPLASSNWGAAYLTQGIVAPGEQILGAAPGGGTDEKSGTSFATAIVAGVSALLLSLQLHHGQVADPRGVRAAILNGALPCELLDKLACRKFLAGRICIPGAIANILPSLSLDSDNGEPSLRLSAAARVPSQQQVVEDERNQRTGGVNVVQTEQNTPQMQLSETTGPAQEAVRRNTESEAVSPPTNLITTAAAPPAVSPSDCGCGGKCSGSTKPSLVYALGLLTHDFGTEARRDSLVQQGLGNPADPAALVAFLTANPHCAPAVTWVLNQESTPIYAVQPMGPFAELTYTRLREFLNAQVTESVEQVSIPGYITGKTALLNGQVVPAVAPELRGLYSWSTKALVKAVAGDPPRNPNDQDGYKKKTDDIQNFLERIYYELRNLGILPQDRATNYSATNAFQAEEIFKKAISQDLKLDAIQVEKSPICRPGSDCWDVKLTFFNPSKRLEQARHVFRATVDVSDVIPVSVGKIRDWDEF
jgi:cyanobactin maturation PatA/PatG family protease